MHRELRARALHADDGPEVDHQLEGRFARLGKARRFQHGAHAHIDFFAIDVRVGTVLEATRFPEARKPALKLVIDFGPVIGVKRSSAQLTMHYGPESLIGRQVVAVINIGTRRVAGFTSEVLVLGAMPSATEVILLAADRPVENGTRIG